MTVRQEFDGLAADYERFRPRYPSTLLKAVAAKLPPGPAPRVVDAGAGTGVALEGLLPLLPPGARVAAADISQDMISRGRQKFPQVEWHVTEAEPFLERSSEVTLVVAAQSYQWMDRPRFRRAARACLVPGGCLAVLQNNRDYGVSEFLSEYESLLEELSPGYSRSYRAFDVAAELQEAFGNCQAGRTTWERAMRREDFAGMTRSSTQVQRALDACGEEFTRRLEKLIDAYADDGELRIAYTSEAFTATRPASPAAR